MRVGVIKKLRRLPWYSSKGRGMPGEQRCMGDDAKQEDAKEMVSPCAASLGDAYGDFRYREVYTGPCFGSTARSGRA